MIARPAVKKTPDSLLLVEIKSYKMDNISFYFSMYNSDLHYIVTHHRFQHRVEYLVNYPIAVLLQISIPQVDYRELLL